MKILSEDETTVAPDGHLKSAATATKEATNLPAEGLDRLEEVNVDADLDSDAAETVDVGTQTTNKPTWPVVPSLTRSTRIQVRT